MQKLILTTGAVLAALAVAIGAFGAHALKETLAANQRLETFNTAVAYQFYHSLGILIIGALMFTIPNKYLQYAAWLHVAGILFFSGSLYILCLTGNTRLGAVTPVGGLLFIVGWVLLAVAVLKSP